MADYQLNNSAESARNQREIIERVIERRKERRKKKERNGHEGVDKVGQDRMAWLVVNYGALLLLLN